MEWALLVISEFWRILANFARKKNNNPNLAECCLTVSEFVFRIARQPGSKLHAKRHSLELWKRSHTLDQRNELNGKKMFVFSPRWKVYWFGPIFNDNSFLGLNFVDLFKHNIKLFYHVTLNLLILGPTFYWLLISEVPPLRPSKLDKLWRDRRHLLLGGNPQRKELEKWRYKQHCYQTIILNNSYPQVLFKVREYDSFRK